MKYLRYQIKKNPSIIFYSIIGFIVIALFMTVLVDIVNVFGVKNYMVQTLSVPYFWYHLWGIPVNLMQFYLLGLTVLAFGINAGTAYGRQDKQAFNFWGLLGIGMILLTIEDSADIRDMIRIQIEGIAGEGKYGIISTIYELLHFAVLGIIMLYPVIRYRQVYWGHYNTRKYFIIGYLSYAISQVSSWAGSAFGEILEYNDLYQVIGEFFMTRVFIRNEITQSAYDIARDTYPWIDFYLLDMVYEESLELIGIGALLTAMCYFFVYYKENNQK